jgi:phosphoribosylamine--glycine ligase/phosphoribosylformylglycinamidine cyclo-ligase
MRILVIGSGGREHALAWKLAQSPRVTRVYVAPGNGGTSAVAENVPIAATDIPALLSFAQDEAIDLTVVGPEAPLVAGLVDAFTAAGRRAFGPSAAAARLEGSKAFAKTFMLEEGIPTAPAAIFREYAAAQDYLRRQEAPVVVKASGLAAGKGVLVCSTLDKAAEALRQIMVERAFGAAGDEVLIETCLSGQEASLLAFCDGQRVVPMLPARDYKRIGEEDRGPNTGGMGGYAPSLQLTPDLVEQALVQVLQPAVAGMRQRGVPYVGVLYAGLMLTSAGLRVLEFNCRFGDPETQVLLPLLESDLVEIIMACLEGRLDPAAVRWQAGQAATVVLAVAGYPGSYRSGDEIVGVEEAGLLPGVVVFHAGTKREGERLLTAGGRVLAVTATAPDLLTALEQAYAAVSRIRFAGARYRIDIGAEALRRPPGQAAASSAPSVGAYAAAGVDIAAGSRAIKLMRAAVQSTYTPAVLAGIGAFGGLFSLEALLRAEDPVLVASTDGVGTKALVAAAMGRYDTVGHDIVNHCVNDILVQGARPLFFLDYVASARLDPEQVATIVRGCADACRAVGCVLLGGETAEMPGVYEPGAFDLVGTMVGWVERARILDGYGVQPGDVCLGLPSSGLHSNGYSLARRVFADTSWKTVLPGLGRPLGEVLLSPHRAYLGEVEALWAAGVQVKAMAHITGGGFPDNIPRVLPPGVGVRLMPVSWQAPAIFRLIQQRGGVEEAEMYRVFNMGIGMVLLLGRRDVDLARAVLPEAVVIGQAVAWDGNRPRVLFG